MREAYGGKRSILRSLNRSVFSTMVDPQNNDLLLKNNVVDHHAIFTHRDVHLPKTLSVLNRRTAAWIMTKAIPALRIFSAAL